jgi:murein L,D-transpeptidase YcbB/YkuD
LIHRNQRRLALCDTRDESEPAGCLESAIVKLLLALVLANSLCAAADVSLPAGVQPAASSDCLSCNAFDRFYDIRANALAWTGRRNRQNYAALLDAVRGADAHGLDADDYALSELEAASPRRGDRELDETATRAYFALARDLMRGRLDPRAFEQGWTAPRRDLDLAAHLAAALDDRRVVESLEILAPRDRIYTQLRRALASHRAVEAKGDWPRIDTGPVLHPGDRSPRVAQLRTRLEATGEIFRQVPATERDVFDADIAAAILRIQRRAHLEGDGCLAERPARRQGAADRREPGAPALAARPAGWPSAACQYSRFLARGME